MSNPENVEPRTPTPHNHALWKFFHDEHGLTLTESEIYEIERVVSAQLQQERDALSEQCIQIDSRDELAKIKSRTSKRLTYVTDQWGGEDVTHFELQWRKQTCQVTVTDEKIEFFVFGKVNKDSVNYFEITPL